MILISFTFTKKAKKKMLGCNDICDRRSPIPMTDMLISFHHLNATLGQGNCSK